MPMLAFCSCIEPTLRPFLLFRLNSERSLLIYILQKNFILLFLSTGECGRTLMCLLKFYLEVVVQ